MRVKSYGLFWRRDEIEWKPGKGAKDTFRLIGRIGAQRGKIRVADFRYQHGIYILYDNYGPSYVGLTRDMGLGSRLKSHAFDRRKGPWDRFSWFGFTALADDPSAKGVLPLKQNDTEVTEDQWTTIGDLEALLIHSIGPKRNRAIMSFDEAEEWTQIRFDDVDKYLARAKP